MSALHEAFDEIAADVPVYGDLDLAVEQADLEQRRLRTVLAGVVAAAAAVAVIVGAVALTRGGDDVDEPVGPAGPSTPAPTRSQSPQTWVDTVVTPVGGYGWMVPDPVQRARDGWYAAATDYLDPSGEHLDPPSEDGSTFIWRDPGSVYPVEGHLGIILPTDQPDPMDGCDYLLDGPLAAKESCTDESWDFPGVENAEAAYYERLCDSWGPGSPGDDARPGPGVTYETCGDFRVSVAVERRDGAIGYVVVEGRGTVFEYNPFGTDMLAALAADRRLTLPDAAYDVPSNDTVTSVVADHFPGWRLDPETRSVAERPGYAEVWGRLGPSGLSVRVWPAGADPTCGRSSLVRCVERRVYGADDPTTVYVGAWDEEGWADCCPRSSRAYSRQLVYVGPRHTVVASLTRVVREPEDGIGPELDQRVIDLLLDPRLQQGGEQ
ncbi:MAG TPA: hypothetical protein VNS55_03105 [Nocardioides sp.]|nr:hypothetical protein [Nocardioides sp.]